MWTCFRCGLEWHDAIVPGVCPKCGGVESYDQAGEGYASPRQAFGIADVDLPRISTGEECVDEILDGGFVEGTRVMMWGRGGSGKSRLAMRWGTGGANCLYISLEMFEPIAKHTAKSVGADLRRLFITESYSRFRKKAQECRARIIVLDSISVVPREEQRELLTNLKNWAEKTAGVAIVLCHQNKRGLHAGSHVIQHWGDCEIFLKAGKTRSTLVEILKSRGCPLGVTRTTLGSDFIGCDSETADHEPSDETDEPEAQPRPPGPPVILS